MKTELKGSQAFSYIEVELQPGETIISESDAMSSMDAELDLSAKLNGGFFKGLLRKYLGGESLFINHFTNNTSQPRRMTLVQGTPGEIRHRKMDNDEIYLQPGAFVACSEEVKLSLEWAGLVSFIDLFYGAYGALLEREIDGEYIVDTSHLVAYDPSIKLKLQLAGGIFSSFFGGEGLVTRVEGKGKIVIQSRSITGLTGWLNPKFW